MILKKDQKADIARRMDFIQVQLGDLNRLSSINWETYQRDRDAQRNIERLAENIANAIIDISKIILAGDEIGMPNSYREIIIKLGDIGVVGKKLAMQVAEFAALRNILAHEYLDIRWDKIKSFISDAPIIIPKFTSAISKKV